MPEIVIKQSHVVAKYASLKENQHLLNMLKIKAIPKKFRESVEKIEKAAEFNNRTYEQAIVPAIYPSLDYNYFQGGKPNIALLADHDNWFYKITNQEKIGQMIASDVENFKKSTSHNIYAGPQKTFLKSFRLSFNFANSYQINSLYQTQDKKL